MSNVTNHCVLLLADDPAVAESFRRIAAQMISWVDRPTGETAARSDATSGFRSWEIELVSDLPDALNRIRQAVLERQPYSVAVLCPQNDDERSLRQICTQILTADRFLPVLLCSETAHQLRDGISALLAAPERMLIVAPPPDESLVRHWLAAQADRREIRAQLQQCEHELACARAASARAREIVEEASRAKTEFLSNISHELRTPMNAILGFSRLLRQESLPAAQAEKLGFIHNAATALEGILENMLDLSLLSEGKLHLSSEVFRLDTVLQEVVDAVGPAIQGKELGLYCHIEPSIPRWLEQDRGRFRQVLSNLLSNAIKFTERGSIHVRATLDEQDDQTATVRIVVSDTGVGIPMDRQAIIFDSFSQADGSVTRRFGGVGVGLSICKQLLDLLGGQIGFRSTLGIGSSFWFTIPFRRALAPEPEPPDSPLCHVASHTANPSAGGSQTADERAQHVLVVDQEYLSRSILELLLVRAGCFVDLVSNPSEALDALQPNLYGIIFFDFDSPDRDLRQLIRKVRDHEDGARHQCPTRLIAMGQLEASLGRKRATELGVDEFLAKPFSAETFFELIGRFLPTPLDSPRQDAIDDVPEPDALLPQWILQLHEALKQQDFQVLEHGAQTLKTTATRWGSRVLADHAMRIQLAARNNDTHRAAAAIQRLVVCCSNRPRLHYGVPVPLAH